MGHLELTSRQFWQIRPEEANMKKYIYLIYSAAQATEIQNKPKVVSYLTKFNSSIDEPDSL